MLSFQSKTSLSSLLENVDCQMTKILHGLDSIKPINTDAVNNLFHSLNGLRTYTLSGDITYLSIRDFKFFTVEGLRAYADIERHMSPVERSKDRATARHDFYNVIKTARWLARNWNFLQDFDSKHIAQTHKFVR